MSFNIKILWRWWGNWNAAALRVPGVSVQHDLQYTVEWFRLEGIHGGHLVQHTDSRANFEAGSGCSGSFEFSIHLRMKMSQSLCKSFDQSHLKKKPKPHLLMQYYSCRFYSHLLSAVENLSAMWTGLIPTWCNSYVVWLKTDLKKLNNYTAHLFSRHD